MRISIAVYGKYHAVRHIACAFGTNIDLHKYPLIHRRRDDGPPSPQSSAEPSGRRLVWVWFVDAPAKPHPFRHAKGVPPFPIAGTSTPQSLPKIGRLCGVGWLCGEPPRGDNIHASLQRSAKPSGKSRCVILFLIFNYPNGGEWCGLTQPVTEIGAY